MHMHVCASVCVCGGGRREREREGERERERERESPRNEYRSYSCKRIQDASYTRIDYISYMQSAADAILASTQIYIMYHIRV